MNKNSKSQVMIYSFLNLGPNMGLQGWLLMSKKDSSMNSLRSYRTTLPSLYGSRGPLGTARIYTSVMVIESIQAL